MTCAELHRVDDHFRARLSPAAEQALRRHLPVCAACHARYERHLLLERLSRRPAKPRLARALGLRTPRRLRFRFARPLAGLTLASAVAVALLLLLRPPAAPEFGVRGGAPPAASTAPALQIFRIAPGGRPRAVDGSIAAQDELGFRYRNPTGKQRLLLFARDDHDHFYWYQPAWTREADDPVAAPIAGGPDSHELGAVVAHDFDADRIVLFAVFTDTPLPVRTVEALARPQPRGRLVIPGALVLAIPLRVTR